MSGNTIKMQVAAVAIGLVLAGWPGSGSAGIMGTGFSEEGDEGDGGSLTTDACDAYSEDPTFGAAMDCMMQSFGIMGTGIEEEEDPSSDGIMGTG